MFAGMMVRSATIKRALYGETDRYGNDDPTWSDETSWTDVSVWIQPVSATEAQDDKERRTTEYRMFLEPLEEPLTAMDRVELDGLEGDYEIIGEPQVFYTPRGAHHVETTLRKVEG